MSSREQSATSQTLSKTQMKRRRRAERAEKRRQHGQSNAADWGICIDAWVMILSYCHNFKTLNALRGTCRDFRGMVQTAVLTRRACAYTEGYGARFTYNYCKYGDIVAFSQGLRTAIHDTCLSRRSALLADGEPESCSKNTYRFVAWQAQRKSVECRKCRGNTNLCVVFSFKGGHYVWKGCRPCLFIYERGVEYV